MGLNKKQNATIDYELDAYLEKRLQMKASKELSAIDNEIWKHYGGHWSVLCTDLSGFTRSVRNQGILDTLQVIFIFRKMAYAVIEKHMGKVVKTEGDSLIVLFKKVEQALDCALEINCVLGEHNMEHFGRNIFNASGIGYGELLNLGFSDVYGLEVNLASRLGEDIAQYSEIWLTEAAKNKLLEEGKMIETDINRVERKGVIGYCFRQE